MVRAKNVLGMLMQNFFAMGLLGVLWVARRRSAWRSVTPATPGSSATSTIVWLKDVGPALTDQEFLGFLTIPFVLFAAYQMTFAIITPALITGATADRLKFGAYAVFIGVWLVLVYAPMAHWCSPAAGWPTSGALDFAGGAVVHMNAGAAALAVVLLIGRRKGYPEHPMPPHNLPMTAARDRHPVVRLGRVQRRLGAGGQRCRRPGHHEHLPRRVGRHARLARWSSG